MSTLSLKKESTPLTGGATVSVASKMPTAFILKLYDFRTEHEPILSGGIREFKIARPRPGAEVKVNGNSFHQKLGPGEKQLVGGYAITHGIPKAFWEEWLEQNKGASFVENGMIFAANDNGSIASQATDGQTVKSGVERLDPKASHKNGVLPGEINGQGERQSVM